jgi:hypothetical protein
MKKVFKPGSRKSFREWINGDCQSRKINYLVPGILHMRIKSD